MARVAMIMFCVFLMLVGFFGLVEVDQKTRKTVGNLFALIGGSIVLIYSMFMAEKKQPY